jgi:hypothetical protein
VDSLTLPIYAHLNKTHALGLATAMKKDSSNDEGYRVTPLGAFSYCSAAFGAGKLLVPFQAGVLTPLSLIVTSPYKTEAQYISSRSLQSTGIYIAGMLMISASCV